MHVDHAIEFTNIIFLGQLKVQTLNSRPALISTPEASPKYDDSYMGYSVTVGDFAGQGIQGVAVGVPRGSELRGLVSFCEHIDISITLYIFQFAKLLRENVVYVTYEECMP